MTRDEFVAQFILCLRDYALLHSDFDIPLAMYDWLFVTARWLEREGVKRNKPTNVTAL